MTTYSDRTLKIRFALLNSSYCAAGCGLTYLNIYLIEQGYSSVEIGLALSIAGVIGAVILPVFGILSDKLGTSKWIFMFTMLICGGLIGFLPLFIPLIRPLVLPMCLYVGAANIMKMPASTLMDAWSVSELAPRGIPFGQVRMWGSLTAAAVSFPLGAVVGKYLPTPAVFWLMLVPIAAIIVFCLKLPAGHVPEKGRLRLSAVFSNRLFLAYMIFSFALNLHGCVTVGYLAYILEAAGCRPSQAGLLFGMRSAFEVIIIFLSVILIRRFRRSHMLILAGLIFIAENALYPFAGSLTALLGIVALAGIGNGIYFGVGPDFVHEIVAPDVQYTAQSMIGFTTQVTTIAGSFAGGLIISRFGVHAMTNSFAVLAACLTALFTAAALLTGKPRCKPGSPVL